MEDDTRHIEEVPALLSHRGRILDEFPTSSGGVNFAVHTDDGRNLLILIAGEAMTRCGLVPGHRIGAEIEWDMAGGHAMTNIRLVNAAPDSSAR